MSTVGQETHFLFMARPLSADKRQTILEAATRLIAEAGLSASTARIAKAAGVAEGTIFTYFESKDELANQLYLDLKGQLRLAYSDLPGSKDLRESLWQFWAAYVSWGLAHPAQRQAMAKLQVSDRIGPATRESVAESFQVVSGLLMKARSPGALRKQPPAFVAALMVAMAEATIDSIAAEPKLVKTACADGFSAFWRAIAMG
ncbi:TetR/AcrR family transcriptional regulator [Paraburkholderia sp. CNPSo 3076]|uniref:TetR/AcrR family transcriptional regulator n=1 Tax=Paraburkholderia sp. CNPSo 3076 TaxID=2940936 RepID=UPI0022534186|nr:TetR/AcrR family transcriptional regulator [Paraburkholderia sp. CNPSo 3076]MCX5539989.1 TetR/AcrR family transcriptional regulator [Paraburkholderia sp. CNPSo 3076]